MAEKIVIKKGEGNALAIIDGQNDFTRLDGALCVAGIEGEQDNYLIIKTIKALGKMPFDYLAVTEDKHPKEGHVEYGIFGKHCVTGSDGQKYQMYLADMYATADERLKKGMHPDLFSYSIVVSPQFAGHISNLRQRAIKRIFVTGWAFTHCVGESAIAYATQGFETYVVRDATRSVPPPYGDSEAMDKKLDLYGVKLINSDQIVAG